MLLEIIIVYINVFYGWCLSQSTELQYVTIYGNCSFAKPSFPHRNEMRVSSMIPKSPPMHSIMSCNVWHNSSRGILRLWLQKTSNESTTSLVTNVFEQGLLVLPGYVMEAEEQVAYPFHICPSLAESSTRNYSIFLSVPPLTGRLNLFQHSVVLVL